MSNSTSDTGLPLISVIVPVYKMEYLLPRCVESLMAQRYPALEILLIDDGSPDASGAICDDYAARDSRIRVIHQVNAGVSAARNAGLALAHGAFVGFVDSDDYVEPDMYEALVQPLLADPTLDASVCGWYRHEGDVVRAFGMSFPVGPISGKEAFRLAVQGGSFEGYLCNKLFRSTLLNDLCLREDLAVCEDLLLNCQLFLRCRQIVCLSTPLYHYRIRSGSALNTLETRLRSEPAARAAVLALAAENGLRAPAAFSYVQQLNLLAERARLAGLSEEARALRRSLRPYISAALFARELSLVPRLKLAGKLLFPGLLHSYIRRESGGH